MTITNKTQIEDLLTAVKQCEGDVYLKSAYGDVYNLKSTLSQYIGIAALLEDHGDELELFCDKSQDEVYFYKFFANHPEVIRA